MIIREMLAWTNWICAWFRNAFNCHEGRYLFYWLVSHISIAYPFVVGNVFYPCIVSTCTKKYCLIDSDSWVSLITRILIVNPSLNASKPIDWISIFSRAELQWCLKSNHILKPISLVKVRSNYIYIYIYIKSSTNVVMVNGRVWVLHLTSSLSPHHYPSNGSKQLQWLSRQSPQMSVGGVNRVCIKWTLSKGYQTKSL